MKATTYYNRVTRQNETYEAHELTDRIARQLIPQDTYAQQIYVYARRVGCDIREAMSRAILEGRIDRR